MRYTTLFLSVIVLLSCSDDCEVNRTYEFNGTVNHEAIHWSTPEFIHNTSLFDLAMADPPGIAKRAGFSLTKTVNNHFNYRIYIYTKLLEGSSIERFLTLREYEIGSEFFVQYEAYNLEASNLTEKAGTLKIHSIETISEHRYLITADLNCTLQTNQNAPSTITIENASIVMELRTK